MFKKILCVALLAFASSSYANVDLSGWQADGSGNWNYNAQTNSWFQSDNTPGGTFLYDPSADALGNAIAGEISVSDATGDDDLIGFALGYNAGEHLSNSADYFLLTWKSRTQGNLSEGMNLWHVTGSLDGYSLWSVDSHPSMRLVSQANTLSDTGWVKGDSYTFDITYESGTLGVFLDDSLEFALTASDAGVSTFGNGGFGFFNFSQDRVTYGNVLYDDINIVVDEEKLDEIASAVPLAGGALAIFFTAFMYLGLRKKFM